VLPYQVSEAVARRRDARITFTRSPQWDNGELKALGQWVIQLERPYCMDIHPVIESCASAKLVCHSPEQAFRPARQADKRPEPGCEHLDVAHVVTQPQRVPAQQEELRVEGIKLLWEVPSDAFASWHDVVPLGGA